MFREGHDAVGASVVVRDAGRAQGAVVRMEPGAPGTDRWHADVVARPPRGVVVRGRGVERPVSRRGTTPSPSKIEAGQGAEDLANDFETGARLFDQLARPLPKDERPRAVAAAPRAARHHARRRPPRRARARRLPAATRRTTTRCASTVTSSPRYPLWIDRPRALFGSWYEFFPRSIGAELAGDPVAPARPARHGTFKDATEHLDYVASMGFDVVYLPPIHPIGEVNRKGPNNTLVAAQLGRRLAVGDRLGATAATTRSTPSSARWPTSTRSCARASELGMEVALDFALQCAPDHPWVTTHPEWFTTKPDGTIAYAENPPKKYQDIYPLNFDNDPRACTPSACGSCGTGSRPGVRIFRVDNPHTKPLNFWQWLIAEVRKTDPDVLFLAEAFTRPAMMHELAKIGFHQSYTYFTWRTEKDELEDLRHASSPSTAHYMRPNFFVNTPDILHEYLQIGGPAVFAIRAVLAATAVADLGRVLRLRAVRAPAGAAGQRGVPRLGEVPAAPARLRRRRSPTAARSRR